MGRIKYIDIAKGILIMLVVVGHTDFGEFGNFFAHTLILWFHMPAFFLISGVLFKMPISNPVKNKTTFVKAVKHYIVPYFSWCLILWIIFRQESLVKNFIRVCYGGCLNTNMYSFPFWFINSLCIGFLFLSVVIYYKNKSRSFQITTCLCLFSLAHLLKSNIVDLPWGIGQSLVAIPFMFLGYWGGEIIY